jgi:signal transduction histidine kinase
MKSIISDFLDFSRIRGNLFKKVMREFNVKELVNEIVDVLSFQCEAIGIAIITKFINFD